MAVDNESFGRFFEALDELSELANGGPDDTDTGSADFLAAVQSKAQAVNDAAGALTVSDVDQEYDETEDEGGPDDNTD